MYIKQLLTAVAVCVMAVSAHAATIVGPSPYLALADTPDGVFHQDAVLCVQDFEDPNGPWEDGFSIDVGQRIGPKFTSGDGVPVTDSVDADDNAIDGDGTMGSSWFTPTRALNITFDEPTVSAGFVFTDADVNATMITIEAFGNDGSLLTSGSYDAAFLDDVFTGTTQEDRFFGVVAMGTETIKRVRVAIDRGIGIEIDHIQFSKSGEVIPEPTSVLMLAMGLMGFAGIRRRRRS